MKVHADPRSVNCRKVIAGMHFLDAPFELASIDYFAGEHAGPDYTALNPNQALPALTDEDFILWESNAILQYVADKLGRDSAYPKDLKARADVNRWLLWEASTWFPSCYVYLVENCVKPVLQGEPDPAVIAGENDRFHKLAGILDARLSNNKWLCGDQPTIADIAVAAPMHLHGWQQLPLEQHKNLSRWITKQVETLPAWEKSYIGEGFTTTREAA